VTGIATAADTVAGGATRPLPGALLRIDAGEVQVAGSLACRQWLGDEAPAGGWLPTGVAGSIDAQGMLTAEGRVDDLLVTAGADLVHAPAIEAQLRAQPGVDDAVVLGDGRRYVTAIIAADQQHADAAAGAVNDGLSRAEAVRRVRVVAGGLDLGDASGAKRRQLAVERYAYLVDELYR
jgi:long-chain acyl-CoA synthetase